MSGLSKFRAQTGQTDRHTERDKRNRTYYHAAFADGNLRET